MIDFRPVVVDKAVIPHDLYSVFATKFYKSLYFVVADERPMFRRDLRGKIA